MADKIGISKSGLIVKDDSKLGLLVFSKYSGQFFVCHKSYKNIILEWLNGNNKKDIDQEIIAALGPGWMIPRREAIFPVKHFIPKNCSWGIPIPTSPIVINWLLTGKCRNRCKYCYANDLMHGIRKEPSEKDLEGIIKNILYFNPLAVVITGGDPLLSPFLNTVIERLHNKTGIIIDTCGNSIDQKQAEIFKKYEVFVRISLDSEIPKINDKLRKSGNKNERNEIIPSSKISLEAICELKKANVPIGVQTVATKYNRNDLHQFGIKLDKLGIYSWRILVVSKTKSNADIYNELIGDKKGQKRYTERIPIVKKYPYTNGMAVQITNSYSANSVVLVSPDGTFLTESVMSPGKIELDSKYPKKPRKGKIFEMIDIPAHIERYLFDELNVR